MHPVRLIVFYHHTGISAGDNLLRGQSASQHHIFFASPFMHTIRLSFCHQRNISKHSTTYLAVHAPLCSRTVPKQPPASGVALLTIGSSARLTPSIRILESRSISPISASNRSRCSHVLDKLPSCLGTQLHLAPAAAPNGVGVMNTFEVMQVV
jgi:hypothetical protein